MAAPAWHALLQDARYPRSSAYDPDWVMEHQMGPNALWLVEGVSELLDLEPGMRVLDLGCGKAMSSVFLAREFGVEVWAADLWVKPSENWARLADTDEADQVHPVLAEAHDLPFAHRFFDVVVSFDAYQYFGTDDLCLGYLTRFLRAGGQLGVAVAGFADEPADVPPRALAPWWQWDMCCWHSPTWWRRHWAKTGLVDVAAADLLHGGRELWLRWEQAYAESDAGQLGAIELLRADTDEQLAFVRLAATRRG